MTIKADRSRIRDVDEETKTIRFDPSTHGKITGSRFYAVLGLDPYTTEFEAACSISRIYSEYEKTKYTVAGDAIEPIIRSFVRNNALRFLRDPLDLSDIDKVGVEEPVSKFDCGFDHFPHDKVFGGMVDGYVRVNGKRSAILEIKTAGDVSKWVDENGNIAKVPDNYMLQASLYAELSGLKKIVFAVGFLQEDDYESPSKWKPTEDNFHIVVVDKMDMTETMTKAEKWFNEHIIGGVTPAWSEKDEKIIDYLTTKKVDFAPADVTQLIREFAKNRSKLDEYEKLKAEYDDALKKDEELKAQIKDSLTKMMSADDTRMEYDQNGFVFKLLVSESQKIDKDRMKEDGILDKYSSKTNTVTLRIAKE